MRIDLSRIRETGVQQVKVQSTSSSTWGSVTEIYPETVEIEVEEYITRYRIPVSIVTTGEAPAGYYAATPSLDPPLVAVSGPRSLVEKIARAEATLELNTLPAREGLVRTLRALPSAGQRRQRRGKRPAGNHQRIRAGGQRGGGAVPCTANGKST